MKKWFSKGIAAVGLMTILLACGKGGTEINDDGSPGDPHGFVSSDTLAPALTINSPNPNRVYTNGDVINIAGTISDDFGLYRGSIQITNDANGSSVLSQAYEIHGLLSYNFNLNHISSVPMVTNYTVTVFFEDHGLNSVSKTVKIKVNL